MNSIIHNYLMLNLLAITHSNLLLQNYRLHKPLIERSVSEMDKPSLSVDAFYVRMKREWI